MAKVGKPDGGHDPFNAGDKAFSALNDALGALDAPQVIKNSSKPKVVRPKATPPRVTAEPSRQPDHEERAQQPKSRPTQRPGGGGEGTPLLEIEDKAAPVQALPKRSKKVLATIEEFSRYERSALNLGAQLGVSLDFSKVTRALWEIYVRYEKDVLRNIPEATAWHRPSNNDVVGMAELDERLADLLADGLIFASRQAIRGPRQRDE